jgi:hypothetical protein
MILGALDVLEKHGYRRSGGDEHVARAVGMIRDAAWVYEGGEA